MTSFGPDPIAAEVTAVLTALAEGKALAAGGIETKHVDLKEEAGRRAGNVLGPSMPHNEAAARSLAVASACMANTDGGGVLIVGVADDRTVLGTQLDTEWLRRRIYDLSQRQLTVDANEQSVAGQRLVVLRCPEAVEPVRVDGKIR